LAVCDCSLNIFSVDSLSSPCIASGCTIVMINPHNIIHNHPLYLAFPDVLSLVGEILSGDERGLSNCVWF
jgi:hypothetical protein